MVVRAAKWLALTLVVLASPLQAATERTGDAMDGVPVIARLDTADLASGMHRFWFRVQDNAVGQAWHVPVIVVQGVRPGPRLLLTAAVHGDELNGIDLVHQLAPRLDPGALAGTVIGIAGMNTPGILHRTRNLTPGEAGIGANLNRLMPGKPDGDYADRYAHALWSRLLRPNADAVIDLHTQSRGTAYELFAFAGSPRALAIANLVAPDAIKLDPGEEGTIETEMLQDGVPAITLELERPEVFDPAVVARAADGILRVMAEMRMLAPAIAPKVAARPFVGNDIAVVRAGRGGYARLAVGLGAIVAKGQVVATISDAFGRTVETLTAPASGRVHTVATTPLRDPGDMLLRILFANDDPKCAAGC
jgi:uncharacterized protein